MYLTEGSKSRIDIEFNYLCTYRKISKAVAAERKNLKI